MNRISFLLALAWFVAALPLQAQSAVDWNPRGLKMDRVELETLLESYQGVSASSGYSRRVRNQAEREASIIRTRLEQGDFRVGDRIFLRVEGEPDIPESLQVQPGPSIVLPVIGPISLAGVLRSELEDHLARELGRFIREPVIEAEAHVRVSILGSVGSPGFYTVPAEMLVSEALMHAGGPGGNADLERLRIERMGQALWEGEEMQEFIADGVTLDQLNVRAGDQIILPARQTSNTWWRVTRWGLAVASSLVFGIRIFRY